MIFFAQLIRGTAVRQRILHGLVLSLVFLISVALPIASSDAQERILAFHSDIVVHDDGSMTVAEEITVQATGDEIKRGIVREFPTSYRNDSGITTKVDFEIISVERGGRSEPFHTERASNGVKVFIGDRDVFLEPGRYSYRIVYETNRQLGFFEDYDELYWNVTGNGWSFAIDSAEATIELPAGAPMFDQAGYTGFQGSTDSNYSFSREGGRYVFRTTKPLEPWQGLTVALSWGKGYVEEPTAQDKLGHVLSDFAGTVAAAVGFLFVLLYFFVVWFLVGRDPRKGTLVPRYKPPAGLSPAGTRYIWRMGFDKKVFSAALISLAVKGSLVIEEEKRTYRLRVTDKRVNSKVSPGERRVFSVLLGSRTSILLEQKNHGKLQSAIKKLRKYLDGEYEKGYFITNRAYLILGVVLTGFALILTFFIGGYPFEAGFMLLWLSLWTMGCTMLVVAAYTAWRGVLSGRGIGIGRSIHAIFITMFSVPFLFFEGLVLNELAKIITIPTTVVYGLTLMLPVLFYHWLKAPTLMGRKLMDEIEGFRQYLSIAEQERLQILHAPDRTPELFEEYLPYAIALDVENEWCAQFDSLIGEASRSESRSRRYDPHWYSGSSWHDNGLAGLGSTLGGGFASSVSSASTSPGSSSGSSGGGSSGGGGGGGGGSGW